MGVLEAKNITKKFPGVVALDNVDLMVNAGEVHCIVGENGAGKSTLVKILTGIYRADEGVLVTGGHTYDAHSKHYPENIAYVPQELDLFTNLTVAENMFIPFNKRKTRTFTYDKRTWRELARPYIEKLKIGARPDQIVGNIPVSDRQLLQAARALTEEKSDVIILDEPTTSLTKQEAERLFAVIRELKADGMGVIFISHKLDEVFSLGDVVTVLRNGKQVGHATLDSVDQNWIIERMSGEEIDLSRNYRPRKPPGEKILDVKGLSGHRFQDVSFELYEGEILGFAGLVGAGRSEIMQTIFGYLPSSGGTVSYRGKPWKLNSTASSIREGLVYLTEERRSSGIFPFLSVRDNIGVLLRKDIASGGVIVPSKDNALARRIISEYNVKTTSKETRIRFLSGGNQQKVLIGRSMYANPKVLIFDEPTKGIDVKTKEEIYSLMKRIAEEERVGVILVSSELEELLRCCNRVVSIYEGRKFSEIPQEQINNENLVSAVIGAKREV